MCLRKNCSPVQVDCLHCKSTFCAKHIQCEEHNCPSLLVKVKVHLVGSEPPAKVIRF